MSKTLMSISKTMSTIFISLHSHNSQSLKHKVLLFVLQAVYFTVWRVMTARVSLQLNAVILVNNQLDTQLFTYVNFYSLYVSDSHVPIIMRIYVPMRRLVSVFFLSNATTCPLWISWSSLLGMAGV